MSKKKHHIQAHQKELQLLGRQLSRRAKSCCELCSQKSPLSVVEIPPTFDLPDVDRAILCCHSCQTLLETQSSLARRDVFFLEEAIWSDITPVQLAAIRLAMRCPEMQNTLDDLYIDEDIQLLLNKDK